MSDSTESPLSWEYSPTGPSPPTPVFVHSYFGGRPTPPPTPPRRRASLPVDEYAPCPPTPYCTPPRVEEDEPKWSDAFNPGTSPSTSPGPRSTLEPDQFISCFEDVLAALPSDDSDDQDQHDLTPHVSDCLIYARDRYAFPSPVLAIIQRAKLDSNGRNTQQVDPQTCGHPFKLFSLTAGNIPVTGLEMYDEQSFDYYVMHDFTPPLGELGGPLAHCFSIGTIQALQRDLSVQRRWVYPEPIPPVIIRSRDLIGPHLLFSRGGGFAFVVPTEDSIWSTVCQRGVDEEFRPINPSTTVETDICRLGAALYYPQHIVASKFAVNLFLEIPDSEGLGPTPLCEYLGAYVLQVADGFLDRGVWATLDPDVQQSVFDRAPHVFEGPKHPSLGWPRLPYVQFCYYGWDQCLVGLANEIRNRDVFATSWPPLRCKICGGDCESDYRNDYYSAIDYRDNVALPPACTLLNQSISRF